MHQAYYLHFLCHLSGNSTVDDNFGPCNFDNQSNRLLHVHQFESQCGVTCDEVGLVGGEVEDKGGDLVGGADAPHLLTRYEVLQRRVGVRVGLKKAQKSS